MKKILLFLIIFFISCSGGGGGGGNDKPPPLPEITQYEIFLKTVKVGNKQCDYTIWHDMLERCPDHLSNVTGEPLSGGEDYFLILDIYNPSTNIGELLIEFATEVYSILTDSEVTQSENTQAWVAFFLEPDEITCGDYEVDVWMKTFGGKLSDVYTFDISIDEGCL